MTQFIKFLMSIGIIVLIFGGFFTANAAKDWRLEFIETLDYGKGLKPGDLRDIKGCCDAEPQYVVLKQAIIKAIKENKADSCEVMKLAIKCDYDPLHVLIYIYGAGAVINLDQLCMCATESGVIKAIIAKAAIDAKDSNGERVFEIDEITQSQCLMGDDGLAYTYQYEPLKPIKTTPTHNGTFVSPYKL